MVISTAWSGTIQPQAVVFYLCVKRRQLSDGLPNRLNVTGLAASADPAGRHWGTEPCCKAQGGDHEPPPHAEPHASSRFL